MAANPRGEEKGPAKSRGVTPARIAVIAALAIVVIVLAFVLFGGSGGHKYNLLFQNASQLVPDNQVLIGGQPVGSVESIELTDDNLAEVKISVEQELHEGTTAVIRATSLSGVANHYVSISPGPNSKPALDDGATLGLASTTTPADLDQLFNSFPAPVRRGLANFIQGSAASYVGRGPDANKAYKYFGPGLNRTNAFVGELNADERLFERFMVSSEQARHRGRRPRRRAHQRDLQREHRLRRDRQPERRLRPDPAPAAAGLPPEQHHLRQPARGARRPRPAGRNGEAGDQGPGAVPGRTAPGGLESGAGLQEPAPRPCAARATPTTPPNCSAPCRRSSSGPRGRSPTPKRRSPTSSRNLNFIRAYTPDIFNGFAKLGQVTANYDGNGHYARSASPTSTSSTTTRQRTETDRAERAVRRLRQLGRRSSAAVPAAPPSRPPTAPTPSSNRRSGAPA